MKIQLTKKESLDFFHNALCNGLSYMSGYGIELNVDRDKYQQAKLNLELNNPCFEDVLIQMLKDGSSFTFKDLEYDGEYDSIITLEKVYERVSNTPTRHLLDMQEERDDAITADCILQTVAYNEVIFG